MTDPNGKPLTLREELQSVFARAKLPTNPAIAAQVLALVNNPLSTAEQFARIIETDSALAARVMKMSNSAYFAQRGGVTTIQRAVTLLGLRRLRMASVGFQLVAHLDRLGASSFDLPRFWQCSVLRACLAREIAAHVVPQLAEESFLVGLLQDCGILMLSQVYGKEYVEAYDDGRTSPRAFYAKEQSQFKHHHVNVIEALAEEWTLGPVLAQPLGQHHRRIRLGMKSSDTDRLCAVSYLVGAVHWGAGREVSESESSLQKYAREQLKLDEVELKSCFEKAAQAYEQVSELFDSVLPENVDVASLLEEANHQLSLAADASNEQADRMESERDQALEEGVNLRHAVAQYREQAARDPLTGLLNRGALVDATAANCHRAHDAGEALTVFFLDIDDFKSLNDDLGHPAGDQVLSTVAGIVKNAVTNGGCAGRYGGEEFIAVLPGLHEDEAQRRASQLVQAIREADWSHLAGHAPITCSLGAVWGMGSRTPEEWFSQADQLMYKAKRAGKDRFAFAAMDGAGIVTGDPGNDPSAVCADDPRPSLPLPSGIMIERFRQIASQLGPVEASTFSGNRKQPRQHLNMPCQVSRLVDASLAVHSTEGFVLDYVTGGIGLLVTGEMVRGDLVEVSIEKPTGCLYVAGLVAFCRQVSNDVHHVGLQVVNHDRKPIFSHNPAQAIKESNWLQDAIDRIFGDSNDSRRSA